MVYGWTLGVPFWQLVIHDWSKFLPSEWLPYVNQFYGTPNEGDFDKAWLYHQHRNPHHWQYWVLQYDSGAGDALEMPERYVREMVADWLSVSDVLGSDVMDWYHKNAGNMKLHANTRMKVNVLLREMYYHGRTTS